MINLEQYRDMILQPSLEQIGMRSKSAEILVLGTGLAESRMTHLKQHNGPALSLFGIEPPSYAEVIKYLHRKPIIKEKLLQACEYQELESTTDRLVCNIKYATLFCRIFYWRFEEPLPHHEDLYGLGKYWKKYYNTHLGKGSADEFVRVYKKYVSW